MSDNFWFYPQFPWQSQFVVFEESPFVSAYPMMILLDLRNSNLSHIFLLSLLFSLTYELLLQYLLVNPYSNQLSDILLHSMIMNLYG